MKNKVVLLVAKNKKNLDLLSDFLADQGYGVRTAPTISKLDQLLEEATAMDMSMIDVSGFDASIWERCEKFRRKGLPFFIISPRKNNEAREKSISKGARGILAKPLEKSKLLKLVRLILGE